MRKKGLATLLGSICCDKCDEIDGDYDHEYPMLWDERKRMFRCTKRKGHFEDFETATRHTDGDDVIATIESLLKAR